MVIYSSHSPVSGLLHHVVGQTDRVTEEVGEQILRDVDGMVAGSGRHNHSVQTIHLEGVRHADTEQRLEPAEINKKVS